MWQLFDIAYVIPGAVFLGYWLGKFLESKYQGEFVTYAVMISALLGFVLTIAKIKRFVDSENKKMPPRLESCSLGGKPTEFLQQDSSQP